MAWIFTTIDKMKADYMVLALERVFIRPRRLQNVQLVCKIRDSEVDKNIKVYDVYLEGDKAQDEEIVQVLRSYTEGMKQVLDDVSDYKYQLTTPYTDFIKEYMEGEY